MCLFLINPDIQFKKYHYICPVKCESRCIILCTMINYGIRSDWLPFLKYVDYLQLFANYFMYCCAHFPLRVNRSPLATRPRQREGFHKSVSYFILVKVKKLINKNVKNLISLTDRSPSIVFFSTNLMISVCCRPSFC